MEGQWYIRLGLPSLAAAVALLSPVWRLYFINQSQFAVSPAGFISCCCLAGLALAGMFCLLLRAAQNRAGFPVLYACLPGLALTAILQYGLWSDLFDLNYMDEMLSWDVRLFFAALHLLMLALPCIAAFVFRKQCVRWGAKIALIILLTQWVSAVEAVYTGRANREYYDFLDYSIHENDKFTFGTGENIVVIVVDCMGESIMKNVLQKYPELRQSLKDFTCFDRMSSPLPKTMFAVPALLTGKNFARSMAECESLDNHGAYLRDACRGENSIFMQAAANGYRREGYPYVLQTISYAPEVIDNSLVLRSEEQLVSMRKIWETVLERQVPVFIGHVLKGKNTAVREPFVVPGANTRDVRSHDQIFMSRLQQEFRVGPVEKVMKYLHLQGAHDPVTTDEKLQTSFHVLKYQQLRGSMTIVETLLQKMKESNIYDRATIVITGDHTERYSPEIITFIKRPGERHAELEVNSIDCQIADIATTVIRESKLDENAPSLFDRPPVASSRSRLTGIREFGVFPAWQKVDLPSAAVELGEVLQGTFVLRGKNIQVELYGDSPARLAKTLTFTAKNENGIKAVYQSRLDNRSPSRYLLSPELDLPDGDYRLCLSAEVEKPDDDEPMHWVSVFPRFLSVREGRIRFLPSLPGEEKKPLPLHEDITFFPTVILRGLVLPEGTVLRSDCVEIPDRGQLICRIPAGAGNYVLNIAGHIHSTVPGEAVIRYQGREIFRSTIGDSAMLELDCSIVIQPDKTQAQLETIQFEFYRDARSAAARRGPCCKIFKLRLQEQGGR